MDRLSFDLEVKFAQGAPDGSFEGYGSVFGNEDQGGDKILKGAFADSLTEWGKKGKLPKMLLQHGGMFFGGAEDSVPIGKWTSMREDSKGLRVEGKLIALDTDRGKSIYAAMKEGELDGLSIGYRAKKFTIGTKPAEPYRTIEQLDLKEVSVVLFGMNEKALVTNVKSLVSGMAAQDWRDLEAALRDEGLSRADATKAVSGLKAWLQRDAEEPGSGPRDEGLPAELIDSINRAAAALR